MDQHHESVPLAGGVLLALKVALYQLRGIWDQLLKVSVGRVQGGEWGVGGNRVGSGGLGVTGWGVGEWG